MRIFAVRREDKIIVVARQNLSALVCFHCFQQPSGIVVLGRQENFGIVEQGLRTQPSGMRAHAYRQTRVRCDHL